MKKFLKFLTILIVTCGVAHADDSFDFDEFAVVDSNDYDITMDNVELNADADIADVGGFDIAGVMLGMSFEDVHTLFFHGPHVGL